MNVSFFYLPTQIPNNAVDHKFEQSEVELIYSIFKKYYKNIVEKIADGAKIFIIRFPKTNFYYILSDRVIKHYKVVHNYMQKGLFDMFSFRSSELLNKRYSCNFLEHIAMDCPTRTCYGCGSLKTWRDCAETVKI